MTDNGLTLLRGDEALDGAASSWMALESRLSPPPFMTHAWASAWLRHFGGGGEPWILLAGSPPEAVVPLFLRRRGLVRTMTFIGHGLSDYLGTLVLDPDPSQAQAVAEFLSARRARFDLLLLTSLSERDPLAPALNGSFRGLKTHQRGDSCPGIDTTGSWDEYLASRKTAFRTDLKRARRLAGRRGAVRVGIETATPTVFGEMIETERESWKWDSGASMLRDPASRSFLRDILTADRPHSELWTCRVDGVLAAFAIVFRSARVRYYYLPTFRLRYRGTGTHLLSRIVQASFEEDVDEFDFLRGAETYKNRWVSRVNHLTRWAGAGGGPLGVPAYLAQRLRWRLPAGFRQLRIGLRHRLREVKGP